MKKQVIDKILYREYMMACFSTTEEMYNRLVARLSLTEQDAARAIDRLNERAEEIAKKIGNLLKAVELGLEMEEVVKNITILREELRDIELKRANHNKVIQDKKLEIDSIIVGFAVENIAYYRHTTGQYQNMLLRRIIKSMTILDDEIKIELIDGRIRKLSYSYEKEHYNEYMYSMKKYIRNRDTYTTFAHSEGGKTYFLAIEITKQDDEKHKEKLIEDFKVSLSHKSDNDTLKNYWLDRKSPSEYYS